MGYQDDLNLYAYVGNDPANNADPSGMAQVCAAQTGSRIESSCVSVDADGDGDPNNPGDTLSAHRERRLGEDFAVFIRNNNGRDISEDGLAVYGGTEAQQEMTRVVSQFVGATSFGNWFGAEAIQLMDNEGMTWMKYGTSQAGFSAAGTFGLPDFNGRSISLNYEGRWARWFERPSWLARGLFHERGYFLHRADPAWPERRVDAVARLELRMYGLAGGGCPAVGGGAFGIGETHAGCN